MSPWSAPSASAALPWPLGGTGLRDRFFRFSKSRMSTLSFFRCCACTPFPLAQLPRGGREKVKETTCCLMPSSMASWKALELECWVSLAKARACMASYSSRLG